MKSIAIQVLLITTLLAFAGCAAMETADTGDSRQDILYTCNCGPQCKCNTVSIEPGKCACGTPLKWGHVVKTDGNEALLCRCKEGCVCAIDSKNPAKCGCGMAIKRVNLKGTGIYFCNCGGSCSCNVVSDKPGKCKCGMKLKKVG